MASNSKSIVKKKLKELFGFDKFKSCVQENAIYCIYEGKKDVFISMPTGGGKSLCYQLPVNCFDGKLTIVISPLLALMANQIEHMRKINIKTETINSSLTKQQQDKVRSELFSNNCSIKLLYLTPEMIASPSFSNILEHLNKSGKLFSLAIDEAHCISQWGHEFRPDYLKLGLIKKRFPDIPFVALTATASSKVAKDVICLLNLRQPVAEFSSSPYRNNLFYDVIAKDSLDDPLNDLKCFAEKALGITSTITKNVIVNHGSFTKALDVLSSQPKITADESLCKSSGLKSLQFESKINRKKVIQKNTLDDYFKPTNSQVISSKSKTISAKNPKTQQKSVGIIYCRTRQMCDEIAFDLTKRGFQTSAYHAGLKPDDRKIVQERWMSGEVKCIAATISFGMGVDKPDVRFVAHWNLPQSLVAYYQESGRAGRDGMPSKCRIYYSRNDRDAIKYLLQNGGDRNYGETSSRYLLNRAENSQQCIENFEKMVDYCENIKNCRHFLLIKEFEEKTDFRKCGKQCDICKNPEKVRLMVDSLSKKFTDYRSYKAKECDDDFFLTKTDEYYSGRDEKEDKKKGEMMKVVQEELARRRKRLKSEHTPTRIQGDIDRYFGEKSKILEPLNKKIKDVDLKFRSMFYEKLKKDIESHFRGYSQFTPLSQLQGIHLNEEDFSKIAATCELDIYKSKSNKASYKAAFAEIFKSIKLKNNIELHQLIESYIQNYQPRTV